jgi:hypothetical protein
MKIVKHQALQQGRLLVQHVVPAIIKPLHSLWHQIIAFLFLCLAGVLGLRVIRAYRAGEPVTVALVGFGFVVCAYYGISSFWRARKISRS